MMQDELKVARTGIRQSVEEQVCGILQPQASVSRPDDDIELLP